MTSGNNSHPPIVEPLSLHRIHGEQVHLTENQTVATRDRLNNNLLFTNRPILCNEVVQFRIEEVSNDFYGPIHIGLTTIDPSSFEGQPLPKSIPMNEPQRWFVPLPRVQLDIRKDKVIGIRYTHQGDIFLELDGREVIRHSTSSQMAKDIWCALDLNGAVVRLRLIQNEARVLSNPVERAIERNLQYTRNHLEENLSIYYSGALTNGTVTMKNCDPNAELAENIAVKKNVSASVVIDESLRRGMCVVMQILDMDHTLRSYFTVCCLTNGQSSERHSIVIDPAFDHITLGDEIGIRVLRDGNLAFSSNNRNVKTLFKIDLQVNDNLEVLQTSYQLEFLLDGRVTGIRLVGLHHPTEEESKPYAAVGGGCLATVMHRVCPNRLSGLLLPCKHLCVCYECGQALINKHTCPNLKCRKPVVGCVKVFKD